MIGGATTSKIHAAVKIAPQYTGSAVHVLDASRAVGVANNLLSEGNRADFIKQLDEEYEALGIDVSDNEFDAYLFGDEGFTVLPDIAQAFQDTVTKQFNRNLLQQRIDEMETSEDPETKKQWDQSKKY